MTVVTVVTVMTVVTVVTVLTVETVVTVVTVTLFLKNIFFTYKPLKKKEFYMKIYKKNLKLKLR